MSVRCKSMALLAGVVLATCPAFAQPAGVQQLLMPAGAAGDLAGRAVAVDADTMVVGSPNADGPGGSDQGAAMVYRWTGSGWTWEASLRAADAQASDLFGTSVAIAGDTLVIGAVNAGPSGRRAGAVYVFTRSGTSWTQRATLVADDGASGHQFGSALSLTADTLIVGADHANAGAVSTAGAAYVFTRNANLWTRRAKLTAPDAQPGDRFGRACSLHGDAVVVGAPGVDVSGSLGDAGAAHVFTRSAAAWSWRSRVVAPSGQHPGAGFGSAIDLDGDRVAIGAPGALVATQQRGEVSIFSFEVAAGRCSNAASVTDPAGASGDAFGLALDLDAGKLAVGNGRDRLFMFERRDEQWSSVARLAPPDAVAGDAFGRAVALSVDSVVAGAAFDDVCGRNDQGSVWSFARIDGTWRSGGTLLGESDAVNGDLYGQSIAFGDGFMVVGLAADSQGANTGQGSAIVYRRSGQEWIREAHLLAADGAAGDRFGERVAAFGDTIVIGAAHADVAGRVDQGAVYVFARVGASWAQQAKLVAPDGQAGDRFGAAVAAACDIIAVGAPRDAVSDAASRGSVHAYGRSGGTWSHRQHLFAADGSAGDEFGTSVGFSCDDLIVGAPKARAAAGVQSGAAYLFGRDASSWVQAAKFVQPDAQHGDRFGDAVSIDGNLAAVGAPGDDRGSFVDQGSVSFYTRAAGTWTREATVVGPAGQAGDSFGNALACSGDLCVVGAPGELVAGAADAGQAHVFRRVNAAWRHERLFSGWTDACLPWVGVAGQLGTAVAVQGDRVAAAAPFVNNVPTPSTGSVIVLQAPSAASVAAANVTRVSEHGSLASAIAAARSGDQLEATPAAFGAAATIDTVGRTLAIASSGSIRTASASTFTLGGASVLAAAPGRDCEVNGLLQSASGGTPYVACSSFTLGSRGRLAAKVGTSLTILADRFELDGSVRVEPAAHLDLIGGDAEACGVIRVDQAGSLSGQGSLRVASSLAASPDSTLSFGGGLVVAGSLSAANASITTPTLVNGTGRTSTFSGAVSLFGSMTNHGDFALFGSSAIFGDFINAAAAATTIRSGTLFLFGSLNNQGTILGELCATCSGMPPGLEVGGDLVLGPASNLLLPFAGAQVRVGGSFDCAIDRPARLDLSHAELLLDGDGSEQLVEALSTDLGADDRGFARDHAGGFPVGTLRVVGGATAVLVDRHDNAAGTAGGEVVYVRRLIVDPGATLRTAGVTVYHEEAIIDGHVDDWARLVGVTPPCPADFTRDGGVDGDDVTAFFAAWEAGAAGADVNLDGSVDGVDVSVFFSNWEAGC